MHHEHEALSPVRHDQAHMISGDETKLPLASGEYQVQCKCGGVYVYMARAGIWLGGHAVEARENEFTHAAGHSGSYGSLVWVDLACEACGLVQCVKMHFYKGRLGVEVGDSDLPKGLAFGPIGLWRS